MRQITLLIFFLQLNTISQWQPDVRLTNNIFSSYTSYNNAQSITSYNNFIHIVWRDDRFSVDQIFYKRSTDNGISWENDTRLTNTAFASQYPAIAANGNLIHIVWFDQRDGNNEIYYKRSTDNGLTWSADIRLTNNISSSVFPSISVKGQYIYVTWYDQRDGNNEIYYKRSTDNGLTWSTDVRQTNNTSSSEFPSISSYDSFTYLTWQDQRDGNVEIYFKRSTDYGLNWSQDIRLSINPGSSESPSLTAAGSNVNVTWQDSRDGNNEIYFKQSTDNGITWSNDLRLTDNPAASNNSFLTSSGNLLHLVWQDLRDNNYEIYYKKTTDNGLTWSNDLRLTSANGNSILPSSSISNTQIHILWHDLRDGNYEIYYKNNPTGNLTGLNYINSIIPKRYNLLQNFPNPFNPTTSIEFSIPKSGYVNLTIYDALGKEIEILVNSDLKPGTYKAEWNAPEYPSGVYFYRLTAGAFYSTGKMLLIK